MAIPYGASMGMLGQYQDNYEADQEWIRKWYSQSSISVTVPTDRLVEIVYTARTYTESELDSSYYLKAQVDGQDITDGLDERPVFGRIWLRDEWRIITELSAGTHTIAIQLMPNTNEAQFTWAGIRSTQVWDRGVA